MVKNITENIKQILTKMCISHTLLDTVHKLERYEQ